jgi:chitinase
MMLGGAATCDYERLFKQWNTFYPLIESALRQYKLNGIDLDIEHREASQKDVERLIKRLHADFGSKFAITLAPVYAGVYSTPDPLSGINYVDLYKSAAGSYIAWFNVQFYNGFGSMKDPVDYEKLMSEGVFPANKIVAGVSANPKDASRESYVPVKQLVSTVKRLVAEYPSFGGVDAWEYFNALPGAPSDPAEWARIMQGSLF